ncbi:MAG: isochorismatase family protein [Xanthobacteraceae bacterium]
MAMQQECLAKARLLAMSQIDCALDKCRKVLDHSRRMGLPVAFVRMINEPAFFNRATPFVRWIEGFEPYRNEMIFERSSPSCYSSEPFTALVKQSRGGIVLAGLAGESACLSTLIDAFRATIRVLVFATRLFAKSRPVTHSTKCRRAMSTVPFRKYPVFMQKYLKQTIG